MKSPLTNNVKRVKLSDMLDDDSDIMNELAVKFEQQYGEELERIMGRKVSSENSTRVRVS
jgi:hypothetical protein|tara:strand:+ start:228 stop:407 length:180 start_codon:yes stop_codon:yes gene_type:complete